MKKILSILIITLLLPSQLFAASGENLLKYAPADSKVVFGVDIAKVKGTRLFKKGMAYLRANAAKGSVLYIALNNGVVNIEKNVTSILVAAKAPKGLNPNDIKPEESVVIIEGKFDLGKIKSTLMDKNKTITESKSKSGFSILKSDKIELGLLNSTTIIVTSTKNAAAVWATVEGGKSVKSSPKVTSLITNTNLKKGIWAVASLASSPQMKGASISVSLKSGLAMTAKTIMATAGDATKAKADFEKMVATQGGMAKMFGAGELIDNLKIDLQKKKTVRIRTKISNKAVLKLVKQFEGMASQQMKSKGKKPKAMPKKKGSSADFN